MRDAALSWVASNTQASDRTRAEYRRTLDRYLPEGDPFGDWPAGVVKHSDVRKWIRRLQDRQVETKGADSADTLSAKTIRNVHSVVSAGFDLLLRDGDIPSNPALGAAPSLGDKPNDHVLTVAEYRALLSYIPVHYRPLIETLVRTGSRWGEATALLVGDVNPDADNPSIRIDDLATASATEVAQQIWSAIHGSVSLEIAGVHFAQDRATNYSAMLAALLRGLST